MNIRTTLSVSCALAVTFATAAFEVSRNLTGEPAAAALLRIAIAGILTFLVTSIAWNLLVVRRLRTFAEQVGAMNGAQLQSREWPGDELTPIVTRMTDQMNRRSLENLQRSEAALSGLSLIGQRLLKRTMLAAEHISSLHSILRIAHEYNQPVPAGAIHNLALVEKDLRSLQKDIDDQFVLLFTGTAAPLERDWAQGDRNGRFRASGLRIVAAKVDRAAKM